MADKTESFNEQYAILKQVAETLRTQQEPDLDTLIPLVDKGINAYHACKNRIEAVKKAFDQRMPTNTENTNVAPSVKPETNMHSAVKPNHAGSSSAKDDDIPF